MVTEVTFDFGGAVVAITGAATGIGAALARSFAAAGAAVWILDVEAEGGERLATDISASASGGTATFRHCDVTSTPAVTAVFEEIARRHPSLDALVNNAGGFWQQRGIEETSDEDWDRVMDLNLKGVFLCSRAAVPLLRRADAGRIVNIGSLAGQTTIYRSSPPYAAAKAGVHALTRVLAYELASDGITANAVAPSSVLTDRILVVRSPEERAATAASIPLGRYAMPEDIVDAVMFLASAQAGFITGQTLAVNGGRFMV